MGKDNGNCYNVNKSREWGISLYSLPIHIKKNKEHVDVWVFLKMS